MSDPDTLSQKEEAFSSFAKIIKDAGLELPEDAVRYAFEQVGPDVAMHLSPSTAGQMYLRIFRTRTILCVQVEHGQYRLVATPRSPGGDAVARLDVPVRGGAETRIFQTTLLPGQADMGLVIRNLLLQRLGFPLPDSAVGFPNSERGEEPERASAVHPRIREKEIVLSYSFVAVMPDNLFRREGYLTDTERLLWRDLMSSSL